jgi:hypothetical protein
MASTTFQVDLTRYAFNVTIEAVDAEQAMKIDQQIFTRLSAVSYVNTNVTPPTVSFGLNISCAVQVFQWLQKWGSKDPPIIHSIHIEVEDLFTDAE